jgi:uncharacterized protein YuzE
MFMESVSVDHDNQLAYVTFTSEAIVRTEAISHAINVDFSGDGAIVGVEFLNFDEFTLEVSDFFDPSVSEVLSAAQHMVRTRLQG